MTITRYRKCWRTRLRRGKYILKGFTARPERQIPRKKEARPVAKISIKTLKNIYFGHFPGKEQPPTAQRQNFHGEKLPKSAMKRRTSAPMKAI